MSAALVIAELANEKLATVSLELVTLARRLTPAGKVIALLLGAEPAAAAALIARGADTVVLEIGRAHV